MRVLDIGTGGTLGCRMFIDPFLKKGFKLRDEVGGEKMIFVRLIKQ